MVKGELPEARGLYITYLILLDACECLSQAPGPLLVARQGGVKNHGLDGHVSKIHCHGRSIWEVTAYPIFHPYSKAVFGKTSFDNHGPVVMSYSKPCYIPGNHPNRHCPDFYAYQNFSPNAQKIHQMSSHWHIAWGSLLFRFCENNPCIDSPFKQLWLLKPHPRLPSCKPEHRIGHFFDVHKDASENSGTPKSSILIGFSTINHPFWGTPTFGNTYKLLQNDNTLSDRLKIRFVQRVQRVSWSFAMGFFLVPIGPLVHQLNFYCDISF